ncbi:MAG: hypothetical protein ACOX5K_06860 [Bacteroidales bacterium]
MKKGIIKTTVIALALTTLLFSCEDEPDIKTLKTGEELTGEITEDLTLEKDGTYYLSGGCHVLDGATLTIQEGVNIIAKDDDIVDYILIEKGGKIMATGTAKNPIIMTSELKEAGAWGGLHVCGDAPINVTGTTSLSEIGDAPYGGNDPADNSGTMRYIRIEYAGYAFSEEKEANGFTFYGVGNGTTVEYCQAYRGSDDGFEFFGGTVNVKYVISTDNSDDSFDWTEGWTGKGQFMVAYQTDAATLGYDCDCLMECDNNAKNNELTPISFPTLANVTLIGNNSTTTKRGIRLRAGTYVKLYNALVTGKPQCLTTETIFTENSLVSGTSVLDFVHLSNTVTSKEGIYSESLFTSNTNNAINQTLSFTGKYIGIVDGGANMSAVDPFFENAPYKGAVDPANNWTSGWAK